MDPASQESSQSPYGGRGPLMLGVIWSMSIIAMILFGLRTYTNAVVVKKFGWDYFWATVTLATAMVAQVLLTVSAHYGLCNHIHLLTEEEIVAALKWSWIGQIGGINAIGFGKLAICAFLLRIQDRTKSKKKWLLYFVGASGVIINLDQSILMLTQCTPAARVWDKSLVGTCNHVQRTTHVGYFQGGWAAASDIVLALYPLVVYRNLKVSLKVRIAMYILFGGGIVAGVASIIKTVHIKLIGLSTDPTYGIYSLVVWTSTECWLVFILGTLPSLRALFVRLSDRISGVTPRSHNQGYHRSDTGHVIPMYSRGKPASGDQSHESVECIISNENGIMKTTNIQVSRGNKSGDTDKEFVTSSVSPV